MLRRLLPALLPSWRFFDRVGPSLWIEYARLAAEDGVAQHWVAFRPKPERVPLLRAILRLVWDPRGNEALYLMSCSERLLETGSERAEREIGQAIASDILGSRAGARPEPAWFVFRIRLRERAGDALAESIAFQSRAIRLVAA